MSVRAGSGNGAAERAMLVERLAGELRAGRGWSREAGCRLSARRG